MVGGKAVPLERQDGFDGFGGGFARHFAPEFFQHRDSVKQAV